MQKIQDEIKLWQVAARDSNGGEVVAEKKTMADSSFTIKISTLFELLKHVDKLEDAMAVEETIKEIWKAHESSDLRLRLDNGINDFLRGCCDEALTTFRSITEEDGNYAEAWNKIAAVEYMLGNATPSLAAAEKALKLAPCHFQALNGIGLILFDQGKYSLAAESFQQSIDIHPWSPVSSKLALCLDMIENKKEEDSKKGPDDYS